LSNTTSPCVSGTAFISPEMIGPQSTPDIHPEPGRIAMPNAVRRINELPFDLLARLHNSQHCTTIGIIIATLSVLLCSEFCQLAQLTKYLMKIAKFSCIIPQMGEDVFVELKTIQILGIGHSVIRGLVTTRSMVSPRALSV
jgi:hypothetical protein